MRKTVKFLVIAFFTVLVFIQSIEVNATGFGWGYKKNTEHQIPEIGQYETLLTQYGAYYADHSGEKHIYLTFDNGYEQGYTASILNVLKREKVPATFFITGHYVKEEPALVKRMVDDGHIIGNHSYHHPDFTTMTKQAIEKELEYLEAAVAKVSAQKDIKYLRPPRGTFSEQTLKWANELGYMHIFWSLAFKDWETDKQKGWKYAYDQMMEQIHPGAIVLLHTVSADNAEALERMIVDLRKQGYQFKSLDDFILKDKMNDGIYGL